MPPGSLMLMTILIYMCGTCGTATCCCSLMWPIPMEFFLNYCCNCFGFSFSCLHGNRSNIRLANQFSLSNCQFAFLLPSIHCSCLLLFPLWCQCTWLSAQLKTDAVLASYQIKQFTISNVCTVSTVSTVFHRHDMKAQWASWAEEPKEQQKTFQS